MRHEETLLTAVKSHKTPEDAADMGEIGEALRAIDLAIEHEMATKRESESAGQPQPDPTTGAPAGSKSENDKKEFSAAKIVIDRVAKAQGVKEVDCDLKERILAKEHEVTTLFDAHVSLTEMPSSEKKMVEWLSSTAVGQIKSNDDPSWSIGIVIDPGVIGEPITAPHLRIPPVPIATLKACCGLCSGVCILLIPVPIHVTRVCLMVLFARPSW